MYKFSYVYIYICTHVCVFSDACAYHVLGPSAGGEVPDASDGNVPIMRKAGPNDSFDGLMGSWAGARAGGRARGRILVV